MARQARGIKQRAGAALLVQALAQGGQLLRMRGQAQGQGLVFIGRLRDEFGQAHGVQQAGGHAACEAAARLREHGQAGPERVAGGGAGVKGQGVQEQIGQAVAGQVVAVGAALGKDQPPAVDAAPRGLRAQIGANVLAVIDEPEHAAGHGVQQAHPDVEHARQNFVGVVVAAKDEAARRQALAGARRRDRADDTLAVIGLEGVGQAHDAFAEFAFAAGRGHVAVGQDVVNFIHAAAAGKAQPGHLQRRGAQQRHARLAVACGAHEVDQHIQP